MGGPWEDFQQVQAEPRPAGPWDEYAPPIPEPDMARTKETFETNLKAKQAAETEGQTAAAQPAANPDKPIDPKVEEAKGFIDAIEAGFDMSVSGLMSSRPDMVLPEHAPMYMRIASQVGTLAGDVPAMVAGSFIGATGGGAIAGPVGAVLGGAGGAFALPEGMRTALMEHYEKGDVQSFSDFWERSAAVAINSLKSGTVGVLTAGVGGVVAKVAAPLASPILKTVAQLGSEVATMTTIGAALDGRVPEPEEFLDGAILVGGMHGVMRITPRLRNIYSKTGQRPTEVVEQMQGQPVIKQKLMAENPPVEMLGELGNRVLPETIKTVKPLPEPKAETVYSEATQKIMSNFGEKAPREAKQLTTGQVYTALVDKLDPINQATKILSTNPKELLAENNPYILSREAVDYKSKAKHFFEEGTLSFNLERTTGEGLNPILRSVENVDVLEAYMVSKRVVEKHAQGITTGFDIDAAKAVVKEHGAKYEAAARRVTEFSNRALEYVRDAGILSKEQLTNIKRLNKDYVPFKRIFSAEERASGGKGGGKGGSLKEMKGSERAIQKPISSIVENTIELIRLAEVNRPKSKLIELAGQAPEQTLIKRVPDQMKPITVTAAEIVRGLEDSGAVQTVASVRRALKEKGLPVTDEMIVKSFEKENLFDVGGVKDLVIFRKQQKDLTPTQFAVWKDGKREVYETTPELATAISRLGGDATSTNILFKVANTVTTVKKLGIAFTPDFIAKNLFRDFLTAGAFSKSKITPTDLYRALGDIWSKNSTYYEWLKSGGANGAFMDLGQNYIAKDVYKLQRETNFFNSVRNLVEKPLDFMRVAAELSEQGLRVAEFKKVREAGGSLQAAGYASREITIDFQRVGAKISALNSITAFMNVSIQGLDRTARAMKEDPVGVGTKALVSMTVPSLLLWWANKDDERYKQLPRWQKDLFWIIPTDNWVDAQAGEADGLPEYMVREQNGKMQINKGTIYRLPKPQELGLLFATVPERLMELFFADNPDALKDFDRTITDLITPSFVPDAVAPAIEQYFNKSFFTGRDIIPHHLQNILPEYQFVEYTSETAKTLGKMVATIDKTSDFASPLVIDNYIRSWGGSLGQYAVQTADKLLKATGVVEDNVDPTSTLSDIPFVKSFAVRFPLSGSQPVQDFFDSYQESQKVINTIRHLAKQGDVKNLEKEMTLNENQDKLFALDGIKEALSAQAQFIRLVSRNPEISADEKRQMIDGAYLQMTEAAKMGNELVREFKKTVGE